MKKRKSVFPVWVLLVLIFIVIVAIVLLILIHYHNTEKSAKGFEDEIYVVADSAEYETFSQALKTVFEKEISTPQPEKLFNLKRIDSAELEKNRRAKNLIIAAPLNSNSETSEYIKTNIDSSTQNQLESDSDFVAFKYDLWAKNQIVAVISAPTIEQLNSKIMENSGDLLNTFQKKSDERLISNLYNPTYENKKIEGQFLKEYGWIIYVQKDFKLVLNNPNEKFVLLEKTQGNELKLQVFVSWMDDVTPQYLITDSIKVLRDRLTKKFYFSIEDSLKSIVAQDGFVVNEVNFNGRYALFTQGLWESSVTGVSGPFVNYFFYDEKLQRIYMIDGSVFAPKYYKRNLIQQVDVILQSFRAKAELNDERIEELLDAVKN